MTQNSRVLGASVRRLEDCGLLTGSARFIDDLQLPGSLSAAFVRSPYGHALVKRINTGEASQTPGVVAVYTLSDLQPSLTDTRMAAGLPGSSFRLDVKPGVLAGNEVVYAGEPVAVVIAASRYVAEDAADLVEVDYEPLEAVADCRAALSAGSPSVHRNLSHNLAAAFDFDYGNTGDAFLGADVVIRESFRLHRGGAHSIEGRGVAGSYDPVTDRLTLWTSTQRPHGIKRVICDLLGRNDEAVRVVAPHIGGGFGPKLVCYPEEVVIALCATILQRPVKWTQDRYEYFLGTTQERDQFWDVEIAADADAVIKGVRGALLHDHGAYTARGLNVPYASGIALPLAYNIPAYHLDIYAVLTNKVPVTPVRGAGKPQGVFVMERPAGSRSWRIVLGPQRGTPPKPHSTRADALPEISPLTRRYRGHPGQRRLSGNPGPRAETRRLVCVQGTAAVGTGTGPVYRHRSRQFCRRNRTRTLRNGHGSY